MMVDINKEFFKKFFKKLFMFGDCGDHFKCCALSFWRLFAERC